MAISAERQGRAQLAARSAGHLSFLGAVGTVTGSKFLVELGQRRLLVDCGLYQGVREWRRRNWDEFPTPPALVGDVVLSHTHLDHCGYLPALVRKGFSGPVWCTEGTAALVPIILRDSARLMQESADDARQGGWSRHDPPLPLYTSEDAERAIELLSAVAYGVTTPLGDDVDITLSRAGHVLGSASVLVRTDTTRTLFSGDLGRPHHPVLLPRAAPPAADVVVVESTYGDRRHPPEDPDHPLLAAAIRRAVERGGSVLIPAFAVDRTELVLATLARLVSQGAIPKLPVHVDSPMALAALAVYQRSDLSAEIRRDPGPTFTDLPGLELARTADESRRLNSPRSPCIIISASGMATGGRVVHHLRTMLPDRRNCVVLTGFQAAGTRGRDLQQGSSAVKMMGSYVRVRAEIVTDDSFSVHADADEILAWLTDLPTEPQTVFVVHGETGAAETLARRIRDELDWCAVVPRLGERVSLRPANA